MMPQILEELQGVTCHIDDILIWTNTKAEHDVLLRRVLTGLEENGVTLNVKKYVFAQEKIQSLGHLFDHMGISPDNEKISTILNMPATADATELKRFLAMVNFIARFIPNLADTLHPLRELLHQNEKFVWETPHQQAFVKVKSTLTFPPVLALYSPTKFMILSADTSSYGIGAELMQREDNETLQVVAYVSNSLSDTERGYSQIEKEAFAITWACEKVKDYLIELTSHIENNHKPLIPIFIRKPVDDLTPRFQRLRLRIMRYDFTMEHIPGKDLVVADTLSRQPLKNEDSLCIAEEVAVFEHALIQPVQALDICLRQQLAAQDSDRVAGILKK